MMIIGTHEIFHLFTGWILGGWLQSISIDPALGGRTVLHNLARIQRPPHFPGPQPVIYNHRAFFTLIAGYIGSAAVGFAYIVSGRPMG